MTTLLKRPVITQCRYLLAGSALGLSTLLATAQATPAQEPSQNATVTMARLLVSSGVITQAQADTLIAQAEAESRAAIVAAQSAGKEAAAAVVAEALPSAAAAAVESATVPVKTTDAAGTVRVTYVPERVRNQLREDIKQDVMKQARAENWAEPRMVPSWVQRISLGGDVRFRYEADMFGAGNSTAGYPNFNAINQGSPYNMQSLQYPPMYNVDQNRQRLRLRARLGVNADLGENFTTGIRFATGSDDSPVSTNQSMGADGMGSKYAVWLDRIFIKYQFQPTDGMNLGFTVGRFANPFFSTDLIWDRDLGFDGVLAQFSVRDGDFKHFVTGGIFPVYNTNFNFSSNQPVKFKSEDKWLYGAQIGTEWKATDKIDVKLGVAYYGFSNIAGKVSSPIYDIYTPGDTDESRPAFAQKGNTYIALRDNHYSPADAANYNYQYYGLASDFHELALTARVDFKHFDPFLISLEMEAVKNLAFNSNEINRSGPAVTPGAQNNQTSASDPSVDGGDLGWLARVSVGTPVLEKLWDWRASVAYKYVETDAVVDAFTDSDFGLGGTNLQGYVLGLDVAVSKNVKAGVRWMSADNISAAKYSVDVFQFDITASF